MRQGLLQQHVGHVRAVPLVPAKTVQNDRLVVLSGRQLAWWSIFRRAVTTLVRRVLGRVVHELRAYHEESSLDYLQIWC